MPSPFHSIGTMTNALRAFQRELDVTGHNLANVNTPGYSRQVADLKTNDPTNFTQGRLMALGNGVSVASVNRIRDMFLEARRMEVGSEGGRLAAQSDGLSRVESIVHQPGTDGIGSALGKFFDAWSALSSNPSQPGLKLQAMQAGQTLADRIRGTYGQLQTVRDEQTARAGETIGRVNELAEGVAKLNDEIRKAVGGGGEPNDLLDQRDAAVREMSELVDVRSQALPDGTVTLSIGGQSLVAGTDVRALPTEPLDPVAGTIGSGDAKVAVRGGQLKGLFDAANGVTSAQQRLDRLADTLRSSVNALHPAYFNEGPGAAALDLSATVKGKPDAIVAGPAGAGDGSTALALSRLRAQAQAGLDGKTFSDDFSDLVATVGGDARAASDALAFQDALTAQIDQQIQSVSGVSMDDEMANMLRFQRSYQAAAKALSTFDSVFDDLLGILR